MNLGWIYILYSLPFHMNHTQICILFFHFFVLCLRFRPSFIMIVRCNTVQFNGLSQMSVMYATSPPRVGALTACQLYNEIRWEEEVIMRTKRSSNTSLIHKHVIAWLGLCRIVSFGRGWRPIWCCCQDDDDEYNTATHIVKASRNCCRRLKITTSPDFTSFIAPSYPSYGITYRRPHWHTHKSATRAIKNSLQCVFQQKIHFNFETNFLNV